MKLLLDIGAGNKPKKYKDYHTIATDRHDFSEDYKNLEADFVQHDILKPFPFHDKHFDFIWCHHVLEHLPHQLPDGRDALVSVMNEIGRLLKPRCEAHIIVPWIEHTNAWRHPGHYRFFNYDLFNWFSHTNQTPDHEAYGYVNKMHIIRNDIVDNCHIYAIFLGL